MFRLTVLYAVLAATLASAHVIITYPGTRGNNFITNDTFPFGMQWTYPCGGLNVTTNRTFWPTSGGILAWQPGWFQGHKTALHYVNIGIDKDGPDGGPNNLTTQLITPFQLIGPSNTPFPGTICLDKVTIPPGLGIKAGDNATIQVVEIAAHGASLFGCSDITFVEPGDSRIPEINGSNCFNTAELGFADVHTITTQRPLFYGEQMPEDAASGAVTFWYYNKHNTYSIFRWAGWLPAIVGGIWVFL